MGNTQSIACSFGPSNQRSAPLYDPHALYVQCRDQGIPYEQWWGKCNQFTNPLGEGPAKGMILLRKEDLDRISVDGTHVLTFKTDDVPVEFKNLTILSAKCCTPGHPTEPNAIYYVEVADQRQEWARRLCGQRYNMVTADGEDYQDETVNGDIPWTWAELLAELWALAITDGSAVPTLEETPDGTPENFDFKENYALRALCVLLDRLGYALRWTPWSTTAAYDIVRIGKDLDASVDLDNTQDAWLWDDYPYSVTKARIPSQVNVLFRIYPQDCDMDRFCAVTVPRVQPVPGDETRSDGSTFILHDDLIARRPETASGSGSTSASGSYCSGSVSGSYCPGMDGCCAYTNADEMQARACERARDYYRMLTKGADPLQRVYGGGLKILPQSRYKAINWQDLGDGLKTTVYRGLDLLSPFALWELWYELNEPYCSGAGGTSAGGGMAGGGICEYPEYMQLRAGMTCCNDENGFYTTTWIEVYAQDGSCKKEVFEYPDELAQAEIWHGQYGGNSTIHPTQLCPGE